MLECPGGEWIGGSVRCGVEMEGIWNVGEVSEEVSGGGELKLGAGPTERVDVASSRSEEA